MEKVLRIEQRLQVRHQKQDPGIVERRQFVVQFRIENLVGPLGLLQLFSSFGDFGLVPLLHVRLQRLEAVPLAVVVHQLPAPLVYLFLK